MLIRRRNPQITTHFPYTTLFRSRRGAERRVGQVTPALAKAAREAGRRHDAAALVDRPPLRGGLSLCLLLSMRVEHRSEEHTSELQSRRQLVCRLLPENKKRSIEQ